MNDKIIRFPDTLDGLKAMPAEDKAIAAVTAASGNALGAYYKRDAEGSFTLQRQISLTNSEAPAFADKAQYDASNTLQHIPVEDGQGRIKGFFAFRQQDLTRFAPEGYDAGAFVQNYLTPPPQMQEANIAMASALVDMVRRDLSPPSPTAGMHSFTSAERMVNLAILGNALEGAQTAGYMLPDDNYQHTKGVTTLFSQTVGAVNEAAHEHSRAAPFDMAQILTAQCMGGVHDIGKVQIPLRLNHHQLNTHLAQSDETKTEEEQTTIHKAVRAAFQETNYNHPLLGYIALAPVAPLEAEAAAMHHLSAFRDQSAEDRTKGTHAHLNLMKNDLSETAQVSFLSQMMRVADVADAIINNAHKDPLNMLEQLNQKTGEKSHLGMPSIDPDILCFMIDRGVMDKYLESKIIAPMKEGEVEYRPQYDAAAFNAAKEAVLAQHNYTVRKQDVETRILDAVEREPMITAYRSEQMQQERSWQETLRLSHPDKSEMPKGYGIG